MTERLPGMAHPVQVRPADIERRAARRLFLGLLPISFGAEHIREVFEPFGTIQEIQVLGSGSQYVTKKTYVQKCKQLIL